MALYPGMPPASVFPGPVRGFYKPQAAVSPLHDESLGWCPRARVDLFEDFLGSAAIVDPIIGSTIQTAGSPTAALLATQVGNGEARALLTSTNEAQSAYFAFGDKVMIPANMRPLFQARIKIVTAPITSGEMVFGFATAYNATLNSITKNAWIRAIAGLTPVLEMDDNTTDVDGQAVVGFGAFALNTYYLLSVDMRDLGTIRYFIDDKLVGTIAGAAMSTTLLQPLCGVKKSTGTAVPTFNIDYLRCSWDRA